jgi:hypothetical protein
MKFIATAALLSLFLIPAESPAFHWRPGDRDRDRDRYERRDDWHDRYRSGRYDDRRERYRQEREARIAFDREHPRYPRQYCHKHQYPLHSDDKRRHCHNWDVEDRYSSHDRDDDRGGWWPWGGWWR